MVAPQPPGAPATDPTAVIGRRTIAALIDGAVVTIPAIAYATSQMEYITRARVGSDFDTFCDDYTSQIGGTCLAVGDTAYFDDSAANPGSLVFFGLSLLLLVVLQGVTGWTLGKLATGLRTVKEDGSAPGVGKAALRWLLLVVDGLPYLAPLVGFLTALTTQGHRRVGDMAAKTFVVSAGAAGRPIVIPGATSIPGSPALAGAPGYPASGYPSPGYPTAGDGTPGAGAPPAAAGGADAPQWDAARGTYIQWDPAQRCWVQWNEATRTWTPIPG